jgi:WhiB family redox-sensing transcriptional regulator
MQSDRRSARACPGPPRDESWRDSALCAQSDPELFFPDKGGTAAPAKRVCARCPVRGECLEWALAYDIRFGIWGGLTEDQRREFRPGADAEGDVSEGVAP